MKTVSHPLFLSVFSVYLIYYTLKVWSVSMPEFITSYVADLLSLFVVNTVVLWLIRLIKSDRTIELKPLQVLLSFILFTVFFELYLPLVNKYYHRDYVDVICYGVSSLGYLVWRKKQLT